MGLLRRNKATLIRHHQTATLVRQLGRSLGSKDRRNRGDHHPHYSSNNNNRDRDRDRDRGSSPSSRAWPRPRPMHYHKGVKDKEDRRWVEADLLFLLRSRRTGFLRRSVAGRGRRWACPHLRWEI